MRTQMQGKRVLVTGGTGGIGRQTALQLLQLGAEVVVVGRNLEKTKAVVDALKAESGNQKVDFLLADLSSLKSVRELASAFRERYRALDVLVNNAGGINTRYERTVDGYERTFATNHLAYFLLTSLLLPQLQAAGHARVVSVSSEAHRGGRIDFDNLMSTKGYGMWRSYNASKLANILFTRELARRLADTGVTANCLHPGFVASGFLAKGGVWSWLKPIAYLAAINEVKGAQTSVYLASSDEVADVTGQYFVKCKPRKPSGRARDDMAARRLWELSEELTKEGPKAA